MHLVGDGLFCSRGLLLAHWLQCPGISAGGDLEALLCDTSFHLSDRLLGAASAVVAPLIVWAVVRVSAEVPWSAQWRGSDRMELY
ncbi:MAG TPA: hypothetical protein VKR06_41805 [Ktedonosporobacter sp.]|nr:hypothetical protein [Ktedonosporobacter sp.]